LLEEFGASHGMSFRNSNDSKPAVVDVLGLSACTEDGLVITAHDMVWNAQQYAGLRGDRGATIGVFDLHDGSGWQPVTKELVAVLESAWKGKVRFRDGGGRTVPTPPELMPKHNKAPSR
jgi:hypothetical protein